MIFDEESTPHLTKWLVDHLEPLCEADPNALANYVIALLKDEDKQRCIEQLEDFLQGETAHFVNLLFDTLETKSYLPGRNNNNNNNNNNNGNDEKTDSDKRRKQRSTSPQDRSHKRRRGSVESDRRSRDARRDSDRREDKRGHHRHDDKDYDRRRHHRRDEKDSRGRDHEEIDRKYRRKEEDADQSRDWEHGEDIQIANNNVDIDQEARNLDDDSINADRSRGGYRSDRRTRGGDRGRGGLHGGRGRGGRGGFFPRNPEYNPEMQNFRPPFGFPPPPPPPFHDDKMPMGFIPPPGFDEPYNPEKPLFDNFGRGKAMPFPVMGGPLMHPITGQKIPMRPEMPFGGPVPGFMDAGGRQPPFNAMTQEQDTHSITLVGPGQKGPRPHQFGRPPMDFPPGQALFGEPLNREGREADSERVERHSPNTLTVTSIPPELNTAEQLTNHFKRFGPVVNVVVRQDIGKAYVHFENPQDAEAAWKSPEAVLGNRFIKLFWPTKRTERVPRQQQPHQPQQPPQPPQPKVGIDIPNQISNVQPVDPKEKQEKLKSIIELQKQKENLIQAQIAQSKQLIENLSKLKLSPQEKAEMMAKLEALQKSIAAHLKQTETNIAKTSEVSSTMVPPRIYHKQVRDKEALDAELAQIRSAAQAKTTTAPATTISSEPATATPRTAQRPADKPVTQVDKAAEMAALKRRLQMLENARKNAQAGANPAPAPAGPPAWQQRRGPMRIDNRTTVVLVKDIPESARSEQALRDHFKVFGEVTNVTMDSKSNNQNAYVKFADRKTAEIAMVKGRQLADGSTLSFSWHNEAAPKPTITSEQKPSVAATEATEAPASDMQVDQKEEDIVEQVDTYGSKRSYDDDYDYDDEDRDTSWKR